MVQTGAVRLKDHSEGASVYGRSALVAAVLGTVVVLACACSKSPQQPEAAKQLTIWLTGYSWQDNTPPGSSVVGEPVLHKQADGQGTFADPITVAVPGHEGKMAWQPGTKFYLPTVQRYVIVEDSGAAKQPAGTDTHLDMWIGGQDGTKQATDDCENTFTGRVPAQADPPDNLPVMAGPIFANQKCNIPAQPADMGTYKDAGGDSNDSDSDGGSGSGHHGHHGHHDSDSSGN
ncbi:MAG: hypothetical protein QOG57_1446 [Pseudonocardiales bacterium]|nr:hypothetical protein [Pseudonocardiales bacterium]